MYSSGITDGMSVTCGGIIAEIKKEFGTEKAIESIEPEEEFNE